MDGYPPPFGAAQTRVEERIEPAALIDSCANLGGMQRRVICAFLIQSSLWCVSASNLWAQTSQKASPGNSHIAEAILLRAEKLNGLGGGDLKPWQLKINYKFLDASGKATDRGTIEELWIAPHMAKVAFIGSAGKLVYLTTKKGVYREGEVDEKMALLELLADAFVQPIGIPKEALAYMRLTLQTYSIGSGQLRCLTVKDLFSVHSAFNAPTYCLDGTLPILRSDSFPDDPHQFMLNHIGRFQGRYVPTEVVVGDRDGTDLSAHLELLREIPEPNPADFNPGSDAVLLEPAHDTLVLPGNDLELQILSHRVHVISRPEPTYPPAAKAANVHGTITLRALIGTDGRIAELHVISGPELLRQAALDAVWKWRFEPPFDGSEHAQISAEISVRF